MTRIADIQINSIVRLEDGTIGRLSPCRGWVWRSPPCGVQVVPNTPATVVHTPEDLADEWMELYNQKERSFRNGFDAYTKGQLMASNPHVLHSWQWIEWRRGYSECRDSTPVDQATFGF